MHVRALAQIDQQERVDTLHPERAAGHLLRLGENAGTAGEVHVHQRAALL